MSTINWVRLVLGGLVAGLIINVSGFMMAHFVLGREYVEAFKSKMVPQSASAIFAKHLACGFSSVCWPCSFMSDSVRASAPGRGHRSSRRLWSF